MERLKRLVARGDPVDELIVDYNDARDADDGASVDALERKLRSAGVDADDVDSLRATVGLLRSVDTVAAPRSYQLTPDTLAERGYSEAEIQRILNPRASVWGRLSRRPQVFVPVAVAMLALVGVALLTVNDLSEYATERFDADEIDASPESAIQMRAMGVEQVADEASTPADDLGIESAETASEVSVEIELQATSRVESAGGRARMVAPAPTPDVEAVAAVAEGDVAEAVATVVVERAVEVEDERAVEAMSATSGDDSEVAVAEIAEEPGIAAIAAVAETDEAAETDESASADAEPMSAMAMQSREVDEEVVAEAAAVAEVAEPEDAAVAEMQSVAPMMMAVTDDVDADDPADVEADADESPRPTATPDPCAPADATAGDASADTAATAAPSEIATLTTPTPIPTCTPTPTPTATPTPNSG